MLTEPQTSEGWLDIERLAEREAWVPLQLGMRASPDTRDVLKGSPVTSMAEFIPQAVPAWVSTDELDAIDDLTGGLSGPSGSSIEPGGQSAAGAALRRQIELAAVAHVIQHYTAKGYELPLSREDERGLGWDLTFNAAGKTAGHAEVKGRLGATPSVHMTRSELNAARNEPGWVLAVGRYTLSKHPDLQIFEPTDVTPLAVPTEYAVDLSTLLE